MLFQILGNLEKKPNKKHPTYKNAKQIASSGFFAERQKLATHGMLEPELLYFLAEDDAPEIRQEVAKNEGVPLQVDQIIAQNTIAEVRSELT